MLHDEGADALERRGSVGFWHGLDPVDLEQGGYRGVYFPLVAVTRCVIKFAMRVTGTSRVSQSWSLCKTHHADHAVRQPGVVSLRPQAPVIAALMSTTLCARASCHIDRQATHNQAPAPRKSTGTMADTAWDTQGAAASSETKPAGPRSQLIFIGSGSSTGVPR